MIANFFKKKFKFEISSNRPGSFLRNVGLVELKNEKIIFKLMPFVRAVLVRNGREYNLLETEGEEKAISGRPQVGDIYILGRDGHDDKLIVEVKANVSDPQHLYVKRVELDEATPQARKTTLTVGIILLALLLVSILFGLNQKKQKEFENSSKRILEEALFEYNESLSLFNVEALRSRELFSSSKEKADKLKSSGYKNEELDDLLEAIKSREEEILGEKKVILKEFLDLSLQINNFKVSQMSATNEEMFVFDKESQNLIKVNIESKNARKVADKEDLRGSVQIASYENRPFFLNDDGIYEIRENQKKVLERDWNSGLFYLYAGNIYFVDKSQSKIYRYSSGNLGFGTKVEWLAPGVVADFSKVKDISIDGTIWLLSETGKISRFANGSPIAVSVSGLVKQMSDPDAIYTNENLKNVYVLDQKESRIVVVDKSSGKFKIQYLNQDIKGAVDLVVSEDLKRIILAKESKLFIIDLN